MIFILKKVYKKIINILIYLFLILFSKKVILILFKQANYK